MVVGANEPTVPKNACESLAISIAMAMQQYNVGASPNEAIQGFTQSHWMPVLLLVLLTTHSSAIEMVAEMASIVNGGCPNNTIRLVTE
jgi:hypothetical protein